MMCILHSENIALSTHSCGSVGRRMRRKVFPIAHLENGPLPLRCEGSAGGPRNKFFLTLTIGQGLSPKGQWLQFQLQVSFLWS